MRASSHSRAAVSLGAHQGPWLFIFPSLVVRIGLLMLREGNEVDFEAFHSLGGLLGSQPHPTSLDSRSGKDARPSLPTT